MRQAFKVFDIDGNGLIDEKELLQTMRNLGENLTEKDVKAMIKAADRNGDEKIDYEGKNRGVYVVVLFRIVLLQLLKDAVFFPRGIQNSFQYLSGICCCMCRIYQDDV